MLEEKKRILSQEKTKFLRQEKKFLASEYIIL